MRSAAYGATISCHSVVAASRPLTGYAQCGSSQADAVRDLERAAPASLLSAAGRRVGAQARESCLTQLSQLHDRDACLLRPRRPPRRRCGARPGRRAPSRRSSAGARRARGAPPCGRERVGLGRVARDHDGARGSAGAPVAGSIRWWAATPSSFDHRSALQDEAASAWPSRSTTARAPRRRRRCSRPRGDRRARPPCRRRPRAGSPGRPRACARSRPRGRRSTCAPRRRGRAPSRRARRPGGGRRRRRRARRDRLGPRREDVRGGRTRWLSR